MRKYLFLVLLLSFFLVSCKPKLIKWKELSIKYKISGAVEGIEVERLKDYGWVWEMESEITKGGGSDFIPGKSFVHIDYYKGKGFKIINEVKGKIPESVFKRATREKIRKETDFEGLVKIYKKLGFKKKAEEKFLSRNCIVLEKQTSNSAETVYLWKELPFNMPLYYKKTTCATYEKKAVEIREVK